MLQGAQVFSHDQFSQLILSRYNHSCSSKWPPQHLLPVGFSWLTFKSLYKDSWYSHCPAKKIAGDLQRSGELSKQRRASAAEFLDGPNLLLSPLIAQQCKQVEIKQLLLETTVSKPKLFGRIPSEPPVSPRESKLKNCNGKQASYCVFCTEAAIIQKHKFEVIIQNFFHNPSNNLLNPPTNRILSFKNVSEKKKKRKKKFHTFGSFPRTLPHFADSQFSNKSVLALWIVEIFLPL